MTTAPGRDTLNDGRREVVYRIIRASITAVTAMDTAVPSQVSQPRSTPKEPRLPTTPVRKEIITTASPAAVSRKSERIRLTTGLSRLLRGTAHATLRAF